MNLNTPRFGAINYRDEDVLNFPKGIFGFSKENQFVLLREVIQTPFMWFQSLKSPDLAFVVLDPWVAVLDYELELTKELKKRLEIVKEDQVMVLGITVIPTNPKEMTINLRAPLVINVENRLGEQIILSEDRYDIQYPILSTCR